ncbi:MAG: hypothetical protein Unbinned1953contig1002_8 [Prokaryotic dsDNA virus sp.]|nr:MAG: hypothetical protein Unbinned1953contig1002_8 [Prokaryotic dsDNA virus sp.]|tara:strand:+ start:1411 stop:1563 length:153 start_codon:yes stop_codon:yes gene_type:complete
MDNNKKYQAISTYIILGMVALKKTLPYITKMKGKKQYNKILQGKWQMKKE